MLDEAEDESNRRIADAAGDNHPRDVGTEWRKGLLLQLCNFQQGCPKNSRNGYKQREARREFSLEAQENTPRNRRPRTREAWDNGKALKDTDDERVERVHLCCRSAGSLSFAPPEQATRQEEHATDNIGPEEKRDEEGVDTQPEECGRNQGQNDVENGLPFAAREDARRRRRGADETGAQSVKVATEIGQESDCRRNMQDNIVQQINFS